MKRIAENHFLLAACLAATVLLTIGSPARAADSKVEYVVGKWAYARLSEAHALIGKGKYSAALKKMNSMKHKLRLNPHEQALMWQTYGYIYASQEKFSKAIASFVKCLDLKALPKGAALDTQYNLGQLYMANHQFKQAVKVLGEWIGKVDNPAPSANFLFSMALTQVKKWKQALYYAKRTVNATKHPKEAWLQLLLSIQFELKNNREVAAVLQRLIKHYPKKAYWLQLSAVYANMKDDKRALALLEICDMQGYLDTHGQQMNMYSLLMQVGVPYKAAQVLEKGMRKGLIKRTKQTLTMLGDAWLRAREFKRAVGPLSEAAKLSPDGNLWVRVAQIHMQIEDWPNAARELQNAIARGKLTNPGNTQLLLGIARFRMGSYKKAKLALQKAGEYDNSKRAAANWLKAVAERSK